MATNLFAPQDLPQDINVEKAILASLIQNNDLIDLAIAYIKSPEYFYLKQHQFIYRYILELVEQNKAIDIYSLPDILKKNNLLTEAGGYSYLMEIIDQVVVYSNFETYLRILSDKYILRQMIHISNRILLKAKEGFSGSKELMQELEEDIFELNQFQSHRGFKSIGELVSSTVQIIEEVAVNRDSGAHFGLPSGFQDLDDQIIGFQKSDLIILAARPSMGKTALALNFALNTVSIYQTPCAFFSLEMDSVQLVQRLISSHSQINLKSMRSGHISKDDRHKIAQTAEVMRKFSLFIDDSPGQTILEIRSKARRIVREHKVGLILIDYLQFINSSGRFESRHLEISYFSRSLKEMAKELQVPVIALAQLSRGVEQRAGNKRPLLSDLRESGSIEQDADIVLFIHRPEMYKIMVDENNMSTQNMAEIIIAKNRNGPIGDVKLSFNKEYGRFRNIKYLSEGEVPPPIAIDQPIVAPFV